MGSMFILRVPKNKQDTTEPCVEVKHGLLEQRINPAFPSSLNSVLAMCSFFWVQPSYFGEDWLARDFDGMLYPMYGLCCGRNGDRVRK